MPFNSYDFLFGFLPLVLVAFLWVRRLTEVGAGRREGAPAKRPGPSTALEWMSGSTRGVTVFLTLASLAFYGWWHAPYLLLLLGSMVFNYTLGRRLTDATAAGTPHKRLLTLGVAVNLLLLGWYKYAGFLEANLDAWLGIDLGLPPIALPLAISFFTFQQVAYLVDSHRGKTQNSDPMRYALFVSFFPQLVAGPIVHHSELLPQFRNYRFPLRADMAAGLTLFVVGLAKKVLIADTLAGQVDATYGAAAAGAVLPSLDVWAAVVGYSFQVYFDFSGYSDMAIGLSRMFGIKLPLNFDAPLRAANIVELWRRWHITLSRFLRDYLYIPLGGSRQGKVRRYVNLMITMVLGGLWHGANWTFIMWGFLHGAFLMINHGFRAIRGGESHGRAAEIAGRILTFGGFALSMAYFRADDIGTAHHMLGMMTGLVPTSPGQLLTGTWATLLVVMAIVQFAPTTQQWMRRAEPALTRPIDPVTGPDWLTWRPTGLWAALIGLLALACLPLLERVNAFIYWQF